jgi:hypothetical protein
MHTLLHLFKSDTMLAEESVRDELNWLKYNSQPWTEVLQKWEATSSFRVQLFLNGDKDIQAFKLMLNVKADSLVSVFYIYYFQGLFTSASCLTWHLES